VITHPHNWSKQNYRFIWAFDCRYTTERKEILTDEKRVVNSFFRMAAQARGSVGLEAELMFSGAFRQPYQSAFASAGVVVTPPAEFDPSIAAGYARDWNFADVTKLFTDIAHTTPVTADADTIGAVLDTAGSGVYLVANADINRFTYKAGIQNGLSVGRADGVNDRLQGAVTADASQTIFVIARKRNALEAANKNYWFFQSNAQLFTNSDSSSGVNYFNGDGASKNLGGTPTNWNIIAVKYASNAAAVGYVNGGAGFAFDPHDSFSTATTLYLGNNATFGQPADFDFGRVLVYSAALSNTDLDYLISGLGTLWNISTTPVS
jgi:hypothetical protein